MPETKNRKWLVVGVVLALIAILLFGLYFFFFSPARDNINPITEMSDKLATAQDESKNNLKPVEDQPTKPYMLISRFKYTPPEDAGVIVDEKLTEFEFLQLKVISTGEISEIELGTPEDSYHSKATVLKVYLDDGSAGANENNSFSIVLRLFPNGDEHDIAPDLLRSFVYQKKTEDIINSYDGSGGEDEANKISEKLNKVEVSDEEVASANLESLFANGNKFVVTPYIADEINNYISYVKSDPVLRDYFNEDYFRYFDIINSYYSGGDSGINQEVEAPNLELIVNPVFLFM